MTAPTVADAARRAVVRIPDGRTARLHSVPGPNRTTSLGRKARVELPSGAFISINHDDLEVIE